MNIFTRYIPAALLCLLAVALPGCSDDDTTGTAPQIFLERANYRLGLGTLNLKVVADVAPATDITLPLRFGGTAVEGVDFSVESHEVTIRAGETEGTYTVTRLADVLPDDELTLYVNLKNPPAGYALGLLNYASITVMGKNGDAISFTDDEGKVGLSGNFKLGVYSLTGSSKRLTAAETFEFEVVPELSTAVEGVHFEFPDGHNVTVPRNRSEGTFTMKMLKVEEGHDIVTIRLLEKEGFGFGNLTQMTIRIAGPDVFNGTWAFKGIVNLSLFSSYGLDPDDAPKCSAEDKITFDGTSYEKYTFTPDISGDFKNYFGTGSRTVTFTGETAKTFQEDWGAEYMLNTLSFPDINVAFSASVKNTRAANVFFRLIQVDGQETLEMTIDDYAPAPGEFGDWVYDMMGDMTWTPYRIHLTRVK